MVCKYTLGVQETDQQKTKEREYTLETQETDLQRTERSEYTPNIQDTNQSTSEDEGLGRSSVFTCQKFRHSN